MTNNKFNIRFLTTLLFLSLLVAKAFSQCPGALGDPVTRITYGAGASNPGPALGAGITNYPFVTGTCPNDGFYTVRNATSGCFGSSWHTLTEDHTSGDANGYMMIINAANTAGLFYTQTISGLCPGTGYELSAYVVNLLRSTACTSNPNRFPRLTFQIESTSGAILGTFNTPNIPTIAGTAAITPAQWSRYALFFTSNASTVVLKIINNAPGGCGNDLAIDDIEFRACGPILTSSISGGGTNICSGNSITLTSNISAGYTNPQFQWQSSTDNINFTNIAGATSQTLVRTPAVGTTYFRLLASENGNIANVNCRVASNSVSVITNAIPAAPTASAVAAEYCQNATPSPLSATASGTLNWYGNNITGGTATSTQTPTTDAPGTLNYYVTNTVNGCESARTPIPVVVNPLPSIAANVGNITCNGTPTGTITSSASGGTPGFQFSIDGTSFQSGNVFNGLAAGTYTISARDSKMCIATTSITLTASNPISLSIEVENTCDPLLNGKITANGAGGTGTLEYSIDNVTFGTTNVFTGLAAGNYTVYVRDNSTPIKCGTSIGVTVPVLINPTVSAAASSLCIDPSAGTIIATPSSNSSVAYQYSIDGGSSYQSGTTFSGLYAGTYTVTMRDNRSCLSTSNPVALVDIPLPPVVVTPAPFCANTIPTPLSATGADLLWYTEPTGGTGSSSQPVINTSVAGSQTYYVSQTLSGCESPRIELTVNISPAISLSLSKIDACNGLNNGSITATISGGFGPFTYNLNGTSFGNDNFYDNLAEGSYTVLVTDQNDCNASSVATINSGPFLEVTAVIGANCINMGEGAITPTAVGGTGPYSYKLNAGDFTTAIPFTSLNPGTYTILAKDANECTATVETTIKPNPLVVASSNSGSCDVGGLPVIALEGLDAGTGANYSWTGPNGFSSNIQNPTLPYDKTSAANEGNYILTVDLDGCTGQSTVLVTCVGSAFPVKLKSFGAGQIENYIAVNWKIEDPINFERFELEKSKDIKSFEKIYSISQSEFQEQAIFNFKDFEPYFGLNYYKLKMIDNDGSTKQSKIVAVNFELNGEFISVENPVNKLNFQVFTNLESPYFQLNNVLGQTINFTSVKNNKGYLLKGNFPSGILLLTVNGEKQNKTMKLLVE